MKCFITGNRGFIGAHLHKSLVEDGHDVVGIDNLLHASKNDVPSDWVDVRNANKLEPYIVGCDIVFHLAAQISVDKSIVYPQETVDINIIGTQNILELAHKHKKKVIFASSSEVYGTSQYNLIDELHPLDSHSPYAASKVAGDRLCYAYYKTYGLDVVIIRNFNTFGEYQSDDSYGGVISKFIYSALKKEPLMIFGDGSQERDYMHVKDAVQAYKLAMELPAGEVFNFGSGKTIKIIDLAYKIKEQINSESRIIHIEARKGEVQRLCADIAKAKIFGFEPKTDFYSDLKGLIQWYQK